MSKLPLGPLHRSGLVENHPAGRSNLIAADDHGARMSNGHRLGLGRRQPQGPFGGWLPRQVGFINLRSLHGKGQAQACKQLAPEHRGGG